MSSQTGAGQEWFLPVGAKDFVPLTEDLMSYEIGGRLFLAAAGEVPDPDLSDRTLRLLGPGTWDLRG